MSVERTMLCSLGGLLRATLCAEGADFRTWFGVSGQWYRRAPQPPRIIDTVPARGSALAISPFTAPPIRPRERQAEAVVLVDSEGRLTYEVVWGAARGGAPQGTRTLADACHPHRGGQATQAWTSRGRWRSCCVCERRSTQRGCDL